MLGSCAQLLQAKPWTTKHLQQHVSGRRQRRRLGAALTSSRDMEQPLAKKARFESSSSSRTNGILKSRGENDEVASCALYHSSYERIQTALAAVEEELKSSNVAREKLNSTIGNLRMTHWNCDGIENAQLRAFVRKDVEKMLATWNGALEIFTARSKDLAQRKRSLQFDFLCLNLRNQKVKHLADLAPKLTSYDNISRFPRGFAYRLGEALLLNNGTTGAPITACSLFLDLLLPPSSDDELAEAATAPTTASYIEPLVQYVRTSKVLSSVRIRASKPPQQRLYWRGGRFGSASADPAARIDAREEAYRTMHTPILVDALLLAVADNENVAHVHYECPAPARTFDLFLASSKSLTSLHINFEASQYESSYDSEVVANALARETSSSIGGTLERLKVEGVDKNPNLVVAILKHLTASAALGSTLKELKLVGGRNKPPLAYFQALTAFLQSTSVLEHLELSDSKFVQESMAVFLHGLYLMPENSNTGAASSKTISKLSFCGCFFTHEATNLWIDFMNEPLELTGTTTAMSAGWQTKAATRASNLRDLHFGVKYQVTFEGYNAGPAIAGMLRMHQPEVQSPSATTAHYAGRPPSRTLGSQIQTLSLDSFSTTCNDFFAALGEYPEQIQLKELRLASVSVEDCHDLAQCVKRVPSIRKVHVTRFIIGHRSASTFLNLLRGNITLCSLTYDNDRPVFTPEQARLAQALQERNQFFSRYFQGTQESTLPTALDNTSHARGHGAAVTTAGSSADNDTVVAPQKLHYPALFQVVHPVSTQQQSHVVLGGLLGLGDSIAP